MQSAICTYLISITRRTRSQILLLLFESKISLASKYVADVFINSVYFGKVDFFLQLNIQQCTSSSTGKHPFRILTSRVYEFMQWRKNRNFKWVNDSQTRRLLGLFLLWIRSYFLLIQSWVRTFWFTSFWSRPLPVVTFRLFARCLRWRVHHNPQVWCCKVFWFNVSNNERTM